MNQSGSNKTLTASSEPQSKLWDAIYPNSPRWSFSHGMGKAMQVAILIILFGGKVEVIKNIRGLVSTGPMQVTCPVPVWLPCIVHPLPLRLVRGSQGT